jgi:RNA polymerase sigma-70 factor (ECF subfamily)
MAEGSDFQELIRRVRAGDEDAATELVRTYEPAVRRAVRLRLGDSRLARAFDSTDVCQSVLASFFVRAAMGQYELDRPEQLLRLLAAMARHKLADEVDRQRAACRDNRRTTDPASGEIEVPAAGETPSQQVAAKDLLEEVRRRLTTDEWQLADLRGQGLDWNEIAARVGGNAEANRKRYLRGLERVAAELGLAPGEES